MNANKDSSTTTLSPKVFSHVRELKKLYLGHSRRGKHLVWLTNWRDNHPMMSRVARGGGLLPPSGATVPPPAVTVDEVKRGWA